MLSSKNLSILQNMLPFWDDLTPNQKGILTAGSSEFHYDKDTNVHSAESECIGMLLVTSGSLRVYMLSEEGREITLYRIHAGDFCVLSAACVLKSITFDVFIDTVEASDVIQISSASIATVMKQNVHAECHAYKMATERFSDVMWAMQQILFMSFDKRLAIFLLDEAASSGSTEIRMTHEQIARLMGSAREVVTRMLKYFSSEGYVELSRGIVRIKDKDSLKKLI